MKATEQRTIVGVPFYDGEEPEVLDACLKNLDSCLHFLNVDAKIVVGINGPRVSMGMSPLSYNVDRSRFNADISFIKTPPGLVAAEKTICAQAEREDYERIFLSDGDISRLPRALDHMWNQGDRQVVGANYAAYPPEILNEAGINLNPQENALMRIFEADKHPLIRDYTWEHRPEKRLKGSLLLVNPKIAPAMFGTQGVTSDSRTNVLIPKADRQIIRSAAFMHYARVSLEDHIRGRLRHFRAAAAVNDLDTFTKKSLMYSPKIADEIVEKVIQKYPEAADVASDFLLQCSLRHQVASICRTIASGKKFEPNFHPASDDIDLTAGAHNFTEASGIICHLLSQVSWDNLDSPVASGKGVTQEDHRIPINLEPFLMSEPHKRIILSHLGLDYDVDV